MNKPSVHESLVQGSAEEVTEQKGVNGLPVEDKQGRPFVLLSFLLLLLGLIVWFLVIVNTYAFSLWWIFLCLIGLHMFIISFSDSKKENYEQNMKKRWVTLILMFLIFLIGSVMYLQKERVIDFYCKEFKKNPQIDVIARWKYASLCP